MKPLTFILLITCLCCVLFFFFTMKLIQIAGIVFLFLLYQIVEKGKLRCKCHVYLIPDTSKQGRVGLSAIFRKFRKSVYFGYSTIRVAYALEWGRFVVGRY